MIATELTNPDFAAFARSFGLRGVTVRKTPEFAPAFDEAMRSSETTLIEIIVDKQILTPTMTLNQNT
ncbi:Thiamine pyrophosphate-requiring enzymes [hydrothermal vent metagenome]|uniref:Thiamine pyrophosphate-requiring enzymes n=1 Tax=hydrothermal vent metagenome TaxID=652676 RepID=A0A3B0T148_9ZZZZ